MKLSNTLICLAGMAATAYGHMEMKDPPPFRSKFNTNVPSGNVDYSMTGPLATDGSNFPCKGYHKDFGTPAGKPVAEWTPGQSYKFTITGGASHGGGSCQASLSFDKGSTWKVIHSYVGNCPLPGESSFDFTLPSDTPAGDLIFAWTWFNKIGNREMYMNCAAITVKGSGKRRSRVDRRASSEAMSKRPDMFVANAGGKGFCTVEGGDLKFPNPGPDATNDSQDTKPPGCGGDQSGGGGSDGGSQPNNGQPSNSQPNSSQPNNGQPSNGGQPSGGTPTSSDSKQLPGGVFVTAPPKDGTAAPTPTTTAQEDTRSSVVIVAPPPPKLTTAPANQPPTTPKSPAATQTPSVPASQPSAPAAPATPPGGSGDGGSMAQGTACKEEGQWNCIGGKQFQRCASGVWSSPIAMAAGTSCTPGQSKNLAITKRREKGYRDAVEVELEF